MSSIPPITHVRCAAMLLAHPRILVALFLVSIDLRWIVIAMYIGCIPFAPALTLFIFFVSFVIPTVIFTIQPEE